MTQHWLSSTNKWSHDWQFNLETLTSLEAFVSPFYLFSSWMCGRRSPENLFPVWVGQFLKTMSWVTKRKDRIKASWDWLSPLTVLKSRNLSPLEAFGISRSRSPKNDEQRTARQFVFIPSLLTFLATLPRTFSHSVSFPLFEHDCGNLPAGGCKQSFDKEAARISNRSWCERDSVFDMRRNIQSCVNQKEWLRDVLLEDKAPSLGAFANWQSTKAFVVPQQVESLTFRYLMYLFLFWWFYLVSFVYVVFWL